MSSNNFLKRIFFHLFVLTFIFNVTAQSLTFDWSDNFDFDKETGFLDTIFGEDDNSLFVKFYSFKTNPLLLNGPKSNIKIQLAKIDKHTKKKTLVSNVIGFADNKPLESKYKELEFYKVIMCENIIYVFWVNKFDFNNLNFNFHAQTFDLNLKPLQPLKKIIDLKITKDYIKKPVFFTSKIPKSDNLFVGVELNGKEDENLKIDVRLLKPTLNISSSKILNLPNQLNNNYFVNHLLSDYTGITGENLVIETMYNTTLYNSSTNSFFTLPSDFDGKIVQSYKFEIINNHLKFIGTFSEKFTDIVNDKKPGIFTFDFDFKTMEILNKKFIYFSEEQVKKLFTRNKNEDLFDSYANDPLFDRNKMYFVIDELIIENEGVFLFLSKSLFLRTNNDLIVSYKDAIAPIRLSNEGKITLYDIIHRNEYYSDDIIPKDDVSILKDNNNYYVFFGWQPKNEKKSFSVDVLSTDYVNYASKFQYYVTDIASGVSTMKSIQMFNPSNKEDIKFISYDDFKLKGNNSFYFISTKEPNIMGNSNKKSKQIGLLQISK